MEKPLNSEENFNGCKAEPTNQLGDVNEQKPPKTEAAGIQYHDYVPRHSTHGRSNTRTFGFDHEPGTMR